GERGVVGDPGPRGPYGLPGKDGEPGLDVLEERKVTQEKGEKRPGSCVFFYKLSSNGDPPSQRSFKSLMGVKCMILCGRILLILI
ncbi:hypothetical protein AB205_0193670, partial [Aquarana catesbeiana]